MATSRPAIRARGAAAAEGAAGGGRGIQICSDRQPGVWSRHGRRSALEEQLQLQAPAVGRGIQICSDRQSGVWPRRGCAAHEEQLQRKAPAAGCVIQICSDRQPSVWPRRGRRSAHEEQLQRKAPAVGCVIQICSDCQPGAWPRRCCAAHENQMQRKVPAGGRLRHPDLQRSATRRSRQCRGCAALEAAAAEGVGGRPAASSGSAVISNQESAMSQLRGARGSAAAEGAGGWPAAAAAVDGDGSRPFHPDLQRLVNKEPGDVRAGTGHGDQLQMKALGAGRVIRICNDRQAGAGDVMAGAEHEEQLQR
ncbi:hypothetical protein ACFSR7_06105 [Cohnella sp. GCM10020058]|uniref:hypothetical protein n=1 Tax=Cohnella sp. GCM10020058 TaxID=3317330 RepID=UPI00363005B4